MRSTAEDKLKELEGVRPHHLQDVPGCHSPLPAPTRRAGRREGPGAGPGPNIEEVD